MERGQGYLVFSTKVGVEFGKGESGFETLMSGNPVEWAKGFRKAVLDNLAGNMAWPPPSAAGKQSQLLEFEVPIATNDGQTRLETRNVRVRLRDATGYETSRQFDGRVKTGLVQSSIVPTFQAGFDALNVSHQFTIAALLKELQASKLNPLFKQDTKAVGAAVINGMPHMTVFYMDQTGTPRLIDAGYVQPVWAAKQGVKALEAIDLNALPRGSAQRSMHETAMARAVAERDELLKQPAALRRLERTYSSAMRSGQARDMPPAQAALDYLQKLDVVRTALRRIDAWAPEETLRWNSDIQMARRFFPADGSVPSALLPEYLALRVSRLMLNYQPRVRTPTRHNEGETRVALEGLQGEVNRALASAIDPIQRSRLEQVQDHVWYLYEQIGDPNAAPAQVQRWREGAAQQRQ